MIAAVEYEDYEDEELVVTKARKLCTAMTYHSVHVMTQVSIERICFVHSMQRHFSVDLGVFPRIE